MAPAIRFIRIVADEPTWCSVCWDSVLTSMQAILLKRIPYRSTAFGQLGGDELTLFPKDIGSCKDEEGGGRD